MKNKLVISFLILNLLLSSCTYSMTQATDSASTTDGVFVSPTPTATPTPEARVALGEDAMRYGDYDTALSQFQAARTSTDPEIMSEAQLGIGRIYYLQQDYDNAVLELGWLINTVASGESRTKALFYIAKSYEGLQAYAQAAESYKNYLAAVQTPLQGDILEMQGDDLVAAGENADALLIYQQALGVARPEYQEGLQLKIAQATSVTGDNETALLLYQSLYDQTSNTNTKSTINLFMGRIYLSEGKSDEAYARFQDSVANFVTAYDTYSQLVALVDAGQTVDDLKRGMIDYYSGQYGMAVSALDRYMFANPQHDDMPHYFKALSLYNMGDYEGEVAEWNLLIQDHPDGNNYAKAFLEKATTLKINLIQYNQAAQTLLEFVEKSPNSIEAAGYLYQAARIYEENGQLETAAKTWERIINEYPGDEDAILGQFEAGICFYRLGRYPEAQTIFQKNALLSSAGPDKARAELWVGKSLDAQNKHEEALTHYQQAAAADPTGYYSIRAGQIINGQNHFPVAASIDLGINWSKERKSADDWMREKFNIASDIDLASSGELAQNILYQRGDSFWELGMYSEAQSEFESLRQQITTDALNSYRLMNHALDLGLYWTAIFSARQVLDLTGLDQAAFIDQAPAYFNHIRFGTFYSDLVTSAAAENGIDPLLLFSVIRQESFFESDIVSSMGAIGLMQVMPATGNEIQKDLGWPENYATSDLYRPFVNIRFGTHYLTKWYGTDMIYNLAAFNGGPYITPEWKGLSGNDPDLFLEVIRYDQPRDYIRGITEYHEIYKTVYSRK